MKTSPRAMTARDLPSGLSAASESGARGDALKVQRREVAAGVEGTGRGWALSALRSSV
jgi:hypothetical protein